MVPVVASGPLRARSVEAVEQPATTHGEGVVWVTAVTVPVRWPAWVHLPGTDELIDCRRCTNQHSSFCQLGMHCPMLFDRVLVDQCWKGVLRTTARDRPGLGQQQTAPRPCSIALSLGRSTAGCCTHCCQHCADCIYRTIERGYINSQWYYFVHLLNCAEPMNWGDQYCRVYTPVVSKNLP